MLLILGGERAAARVIHGDRLTSLLGRHLFAKAALIEASDTLAPSAEPERARLDRDLDVTWNHSPPSGPCAAERACGAVALLRDVSFQGPCVPVLGTTSAAFTDKRVNERLAAAGRARLQRAPVRLRPPRVS